MRNLFSNLFGRTAPEVLKPADRLRPGRDVMSTEHEGSTVLLDLRRQMYLGVDEVGTVIWRAIEGGATCEQIEHSLTEQYDADPEVLQNDARAFLADLHSRRLVVVS
jgi:hypothetical protein